MAATIIGNEVAFGAMTNQHIARLIASNTAMARLKEAIATASSGYDGVPGTEFETPIPGINGVPFDSINLFGVVPDPDNPGQKGKDYSYAVGALAGEWEKFWALALPYVEQLDNGTVSL